MDEKDEARRRGRDIWVRARTNAFAHKVAVTRLRKISVTVFVLELTFIVLPILCIGLSLILLRASQAKTSLSVAFGGGWLDLESLGLVAITSNSFALFLFILNMKLQWGERLREHRWLLSAYQMVAQKARRLEESGLARAESVNLCRQLNELFEIYKAFGIEPSDGQFLKAQRTMLRLGNYPFGIQVGDLEGDHLKRWARH